MPVTVQKRGNKFVVTDATGKTHFTHDSEAAANAQRDAINISLARRRGRRIPRKKGTA